MSITPWTDVYPWAKDVLGERIVTTHNDDPLRLLSSASKTEQEVNHPPHYTRHGEAYETIKVIEAWQLGFHLGNVVKYISRAGDKPGNSKLKDLEKARWYLDRAIQLEKEVSDARATH